MTRKPNIIFILADDMGYGDFSRFNGGLSSTPHLDSLMDQGLCFSQHYTASCVCNPSRAALLTGRYPHRTGSIDTLEWRGLERLALRETTLADILQKAGYATGLTGKWHLGAFDPRYHPNRRGFAESVCFRGGMHDYYDWRIEYNEKVHRADGRYLTDVWTEEAVNFIERHQSEPFFLHVTYNAPHTPLQAPEEDILPFEQSGKFNKGVSILYAMLKRMDDGVGRILEKLKNLGLEDNTIVLFTSDNGPALGGQGEMNTKRYNCEFNGAKGNMYEGGIRVPMILRWPDGLPGKGTIDSMVHFCDWFPTLLAMTGIEAPDNNLPVDGTNILPLLRGGKDQIDKIRFWQWNRYSPLVQYNAAMRDGDWKLVRPAVREAQAITPEDFQWLEDSMYRYEKFLEQGIVTEGDPPREIPDPPPAQLFNISEDPLEKNDLAKEHSDRVSRMSAELENWFEQVEADRRSIEDEW